MYVRKTISVGQTSSSRDNSLLASQEIPCILRNQKVDYRIY